MQLDPIQHQALELSGVRHGFFHRKGGISGGIYSGLNVGQGSLDNPDHVAENRRRVASALGTSPARLATVYQVHSPEVFVVSGSLPDERPKADAMVTRERGIALGVLTADCGPVLFADGEAKVIGAAHAGWKGATTGILENTISAMEELGATRSRINAVLGPAITQQNYEVGPEFAERLLVLSPDNGNYLGPSLKDGHFMFDLNRYTLDRLRKAGVNAHATGHCTYADEERFYSYRRKTHRQEPDYGRQISAIILE